MGREGARELEVEKLGRDGGVETEGDGGRREDGGPVVARARAYHGGWVRVEAEATEKKKGGRQ